MTEITAKQGREIIDERARRYLGMSGEQFVRALEAGELDVDNHDVMHIAMILPLGQEAAL